MLDSFNILNDHTLYAKNENLKATYYDDVKKKLTVLYIPKKRPSHHYRNRMVHPNI
jgi:hypothetical protein